MGALVKQLLPLIAGRADPATIVTKLGRLYYSVTMGGIFVLWYTGFRNQRVNAGDITSVPIPGLTNLEPRFPVSRGGDDARPPPLPAPSGAQPSGSGGGSAFTPIAGGKGTVTFRPGAMRPNTHLAPELVQFLQRVSGLAGIPLVVGTGTNHNRLTTDGNVSDHYPDASGVGRAADLPFNARNPQDAARGDTVAAAALIAAGQDPVTAHQRAKQGGLYNITFQGHRIQVIWKTYQGGDHYTHVHIGWR